ncbi:MAG: hypothetical protein AABY32_03545 [Nanoarchaeota archaeon]
MKKEAIVTILIGFMLIIVSEEAFAQSNGFTVTSVSTSSVVTKTTNPTTVYWIINTQLNGGGQSIAGTIDPSTIKSFMGGKLYTKQSLSINIDSVNENVFYDVINEGVPIYKYRLQTFDAPQSCALGICVITADPQLCPTGTNWNIPLGNSLFQFAKKRYCITKEQVGVKGVYNNPLIGFNAKIKLGVGNLFKEKTICSASTSGCDGSSVSFDDVGVASWTGSLVTGEPAPNQDNFISIKRLDSNRWQIARKSTFDSYLPQATVTDSQLTQFMTLFSGYDVIVGDQQINNLLTPVNQASDILLAEDTSFTSSPFTKDSNTGKVTITLQRSLTSPNIVFRIRADWIGIVIPSGTPKILKINADKFASGEQGNINVQVQNVGDVEGTFSATLINCEPFIQTTSAQSSRKTIKAGDIDVIQILVSGGSISDDITKSCSVKVYDVNDPSSETTSSFSLELGEAKACVPEKTFADGNIIKKCNKEGTALELFKTCENGIVGDEEVGFKCRKSNLLNKLKKNQCDNDAQCGDFAYCNLDLNLCIQKSECVKILDNGDSNKKIDIAFVGDGYFNNDELKADILKLVDYNGNNDYNGLMSVEPFKSNKNKFNIWMIKADDKINYENSKPNYKDTVSIASKCTSTDYTLVISKSNYRSYCYFGTPCFNSVGTPLTKEAGRLILHEFGHGFARLADEYVESALGNRPTSPNCAPDIETAKKWWGNLEGNNGVAYFQGCSYVNSNIRPTENSIMFKHWILKDTYYPVNERKILEVLNKYP